MGDATGIGPEIVLKCLADADFVSNQPCIVIGDMGILQRENARLGLGLSLQALAASALQTPAYSNAKTPDLAAQPIPAAVRVVNVSDLPPDLPYGVVRRDCGVAAYAAIRLGIRLAQLGHVRALCTAPIHKEALAAAQVPFLGHTEMLAHFTGTQDYAMILATPQLRTILVTVHCALQAAISQLSPELELRIIRLAHRTLQQFGIARPRIAVAGLNPHAGEGGLLGREDLDIIAPAIAAAQALGINVVGPLAGDTIFMQARTGRYDIVVAQYHDQGLIPIKLLGVADGVNITAGLPIIRTSPDHGTAFDIAGLGIADPASMRQALTMAQMLSTQSP